MKDNVLALASFCVENCFPAVLLYIMADTERQAITRNLYAGLASCSQATVLLLVVLLRTSVVDANHVWEYLARNNAVSR
jgi:hypothetical protein